MVGANSSSNRLALSYDATASMGGLSLGAGSNAFANMVAVTNGAVLSIAGVLQIGAVSNSGNRMTIGSGGLVSVGNSVAIAGDGNGLALNDGGWLSVSNNFDAAMAGFDFGGGATLEIGGTLSGLGQSLDSERTVILNGASAFMDTSAGGFFVGSNTANNVLLLTNGATMASSAATVGQGASASGNRVQVSGSSWATSGALTVGGQGNSNTVEIDGSGSQLAVGGALVVGQSGNGNSLLIANGATLSSGSAAIGAAAGATGNRVAVSGAGSIWSNTGDLFVGHLGSGSLLELGDQAFLGVGGRLNVRNGSILRFSSMASATAGSYFQSADSIFEFDSITNASTELAVAGIAELESGTSFNYSGNIGVLQAGAGYTNLLVSAGTLVVAGITNATDAALTNLNSDTAGSLIAMDFFTINDDLYLDVQRGSLAESAGFAPGSEMALVGGEIDALATAGDPRAEAQIETLNRLDGSRHGAQLTQLYDQSAPSYLHMQGMLEGLANIRRRGLLPEPRWPDEPRGALGPHRYGSELYGRQSQLWIKGYGSKAERDADAGFSGYDQTVYGTVLGIDKAHGELLTGVAGGYAGSDIDQDNGDTSEATTGYGVLYAAWGTLEWFSDASISYGRSSIETRSGTAFDTKGDTEADQIAFYLGGGKEIAVGNGRFLFTPSLALQGGYFMQEGYTESANNAVPRVIDDYDYLSIQSLLGAKVGTMHRFATFDLMPEIHLNWLHEFNDDADDIGYSLAGGGGNYAFGMQSPVSDLVEAGLALSSRNLLEDEKVVEFTLSLDGRMGDGYSAVGASLRALYEF